MDTIKWLSEEAQMFQNEVRKFFVNEYEPRIEEFEKNGLVPREVWRQMADIGMLCPSIPEEYGGSETDFTFNMVISFECGYAFGGTSLGITVQSDILAFYILNHGTEEQKQKYLPAMASADLIGGLALTEPGAGSDLQSIRTSANRDGKDYVINGQKTFITNGQNADFFVVACKTDPSLGAKGITLFIVDSDTPGFSKGKNLDKMGQKAADTSEIYFDDVRVSESNVLGSEGKGFFQMMEELPRERLAIALKSIGAAQRSYELTRDYIEERVVFGKTLKDFQNTQFKMAELKTQLTAAWALIEKCNNELASGTLSDTSGAIVKLFVSEVEAKIVDECVQLFGGWGYMSEYPISRFYTDARVRRIFGGTSEIMKLIISRDL